MASIGREAHKRPIFCLLLPGVGVSAVFFHRGTSTHSAVIGKEQSARKVNGRSSPSSLSEAGRPSILFKSRSRLSGVAAVYFHINSSQSYNAPSSTVGQ